MLTTYSLFKFLHIVAVIIWIGGVLTVSTLYARLARQEDRAVVAAMDRQSRFFGTAVVAPAFGVTLISGFVMIGVSGLGFPLWVLWGLAAIVLSVALGATFLRRAGMELSERVAAAEPGDPHVISLQRRLVTLNAINILLLLSAVWAMVFKPTL